MSILGLRHITLVCSEAQRTVVFYTKMPALREGNFELRRPRSVGANDLPMTEVAGLSIAYHAKPKVRERAMVSIDEAGIDRPLALFEDL